MPSAWTPERRQRQAEAIRESRPWEHSTGPCSPEGKAVVARNAFKGGLRPRLRALSKALTKQRQALVKLPANHG